ncbi:MAG: outer membrane lipoprotein-sorting protein [Edaphobacter sp.]
MTNLRRAAATLFLSAAALLISPATSFAQSKPSDLDTVLRQMDQASTKFKSAEADFRWDLYERVVKETTTQNGNIYFLKNGSGLQMGAKIAPPAAKIIEYKNGSLQLFDPGSDHMTLLSAGNNKAQYESFLTLGFGGSGTELAKAWNITDLGTEQINDGTKMVTTTKLNLVSKDASVRNMFTHLIIWVDPTRGISLKQQFFTPSEDMRTTFFTDIRYNHPVNTKPFAIKTDKKTTYDRR